MEDYYSATNVMKESITIACTRTDWGLGEVLSDSNGENVNIFFVGAGEKTLSLKYVQPIKIQANEASHPVLDNLKIKKTSSGIKYQSLSESIQYFLSSSQKDFMGRDLKRKKGTIKTRLIC